MHESSIYPRSDTFEQLIREDRSKLVRIASRILHDQHEAEDVVQATLTIIWSRADALAPRQLQAYLHRAVELNALKTRARKRHYHSLPDGDEIKDSNASMDEADFPVSPFELEMAIADLPLAQQAILRMKYYVGLSFRQIGEQLKISQNTAASRCRYALARLKEYLESSRN